MGDSTGARIPGGPVGADLYLNSRPGSDATADGLSSPGPDSNLRRKRRTWTCGGSEGRLRLPLVVAAVACVSLLLLSSALSAPARFMRDAPAGGSGQHGQEPSPSPTPAISTVTVGASPTLGAVDLQNGWIYVVNSGGSTVSVINASYGALTVASVTVGSEPIAAAYDGSNHEVYVSNYNSNTVSVLSGSSVLKTITVGSEPLILAYDPVNGFVYVPDSGSSYVTVINGTTNTVQGTVTVGSDPHSVAVDTGNGEVYVPQWAGGVSVIKGLTELADVSVGSEPLNAAYDAGNGYLYVANSGSNTVSILSGTSVVASQTVGTSPNAVTYDSGNGYVYVANGGGSNVTILSGTVRASTVAVGSGPLFSAYDSANGGVYVPNSGGSSVSVLNGTTLEQSLPVGSAPHEALFDSAIGQIAVTNKGSNNVTLVPVGGVFASESDLSYNSVTGVGGGICISWEDAPLASPYPIKEIYVTVWNSTQSSVQTLNASQSGGNGWNGQANLSLPMRSNQVYDFTVAINTTKTNTSSAVGSFVYHKDTSKDGLTDAEKKQGWSVPLLSGAVNVYPNVSLYSTNGLANDFLEDQYALNPGTVDSAGSGMLDLWNLTFDLGTNSSNPSVPAPKDFHLWWETNSTFDPFAGAPVPNDPSWNHAPLNTGSGSTGLSNISCTLQSCPGNSSYSAEVLWSRQALSTFLNMSGTLAATSNGGWLRGIVATYGGQRTLTLWGKLSWGANPFAYSTPNDAIADGSRVNPIFAVGLQLLFYNPAYGGGNSIILNPNGTTCGGNIVAGDAIALYLSLPDATVGTHQGIQNYSAQVNQQSYNGACWEHSLESYALTSAVNNTLQYEPVTIGIVANISTNSAPDIESIPISGCNTEVNLSVDMLNPPPLETNSGTMSYWEFWGNGKGMCHAAGGESALTFLSVRVVPVGEKAPTYLWLPDGNSTLTSAPVGLQRYVGEEAFVDVVVNNGGGIPAWGSALYGGATSPIPYPENSKATYNVSFERGLTNLLIPRGAFLSSDFGKALLGGPSYLNYTGSASPPLLAANETTMPTFTSGNPLLDVACYWQNRSVGLNSNGALLCSTETGVPSGNDSAVTIDAAPNASSSNVGGLPSDPSLENTSTAGAAVEAVVVVNLTQWAEVNLLVAALLDNSTGGVNGSFDLVTSEVSDLGLYSAVQTVLANETVASGGLFGLPVSQATPPPPPTSWWQAAWNAVSGVIDIIVKGVQTVVGLAWTLAAATLNFIDYLGTSLAHLGATIVQRTAAALAAVGSVVEKALKALLSYVETLITNLIKAAFAPVVNAIVAYTLGMASAIWAVANDTAADRPTATDAARFWSDASEPVFLVALGLGVAIAVAFTIIEGLSLGAGFLIPLIIGAVLSGAIAAAASTGGPSYVSKLAGMDPLTTAMTSELGTLFGSIDGGYAPRSATPAVSNPAAAYTTDTFLAAAGTALSLTTNSLAGTNILDAMGDPAWTDEVGFALGVIGMLAGSVAASYGSLAGTVVSLCFDGASVIIDEEAILEEDATSSPLEDWATLIMDGAAFGIDDYSLSKGY